MGSGAPSTTRRRSSSPSRASSAITHWPSGSMPRRPARPAICVSSLWVSERKPRSVRLVTPCSTTARAGMWMPSDIVSVAKTTRQSPRSKSVSIRRLRPGRMPAWCVATPMRSPWKTAWLSVDSPIDGLSATASPMLASTSRRCSRVVSGRPRARRGRLMDGLDRPVHDRDAVRDLLDVGDGGGEPDQQPVLGRADDDLLPHRAAALVAHVMTLVEHDVAEVVEAAAEEGVPQNFRGHHEHLRLRIHLHVAGEDSDLVGAVGAGE